MTAAHAFELPPHSAAPAEAVDAAMAGQVVYLTHNGQPEGGPTISLEDVLVEYADDLAAYPDDDRRAVATRSSSSVPSRRTLTAWIGPFESGS